MGIIRKLLDHIFARRVAGALLEIGVDVQKFRPKLAAELHSFERTHRGRNSPCETAALFLVSHMRGLNTATFVSSGSLPDLIARAAQIFENWAGKGKLPRDFATANIAAMRNELQEFMNAATHVFEPGALK